MRRRFLLAGNLAALCLVHGFLWARPIAAPGNPDVSRLFAVSDVVCAGRIQSYRIADEQTESSQQQQLVRRTVLVDVQVERVYKGPDTPVVTLREVNAEPPGWSTIARRFPSGGYVLLFLKKDESQYVYADKYFGRFSPSAIRSHAGAGGIDLLEVDLKAGLHDPDQERVTTNLRLLLGYERLRATAGVAELLQLGDPGVSCLAFGILVKNRDFSYVPQMLAFADQIPNNEPLSFDEGPLIAAIGMLRSDPSQLPLLVSFSRSHHLYARRAALDVLRTLHNPKTVPALVERLDDPDPQVQLVALKALAEITGQQDPEHSPSVPEFEQAEGKYIQLWKSWWQQVGRFQYPPPK